MLKPLCLGLAVFLGVGALANGVFMLISPVSWFFAVPGVTDTGGFNQHFVRDIGLIFLLLGASLLIGVVKVELRALLWTGATLWLSGHALFHLWEVAAGICAPSVILRDFPAVSLPALLGWALVTWAWRTRPRPGPLPLNAA